MREIVRFIGLMALGLAGAIMALGTFADAEQARRILDLPSYGAGLAAGILLTTVVRFGFGPLLAALGRTLAQWGPGFKLLVLATLFGGILVFY